LAPTSSSASPCSANTSAKNVRTAWPKMIGSETFIIVAFRCRENSTPFALASAICSARNASSACRRITAASTISPACTASPSLSTVTAPSVAMCSIRSSPSSAIVTDRSVERKSPSAIVATCVAESPDQAPMVCGCLRTNAFTDAGARRSELPSRSTGLTALPLTASYRSRAAS
jgi:hypothetical protein